MSTELEDGFAEWRGGIEARVSTLESTVKREAWTRAKMDEDLSDLKIQFTSQDRLLKALSKTQSEHTATLREHTKMLRELRTGQDELRQGMTEVHEGIRTIVDMIDHLDGSADRGRGGLGQQRE